MGTTSSLKSIGSACCGQFAEDPKPSKTFQPEKKYDFDSDPEEEENDIIKIPEQSPINLITPKKVKKLELVKTQLSERPFAVLYPPKITGCRILNTGHTIQINLPNEPICKIFVDKQPYVLKQFHFHTPSEHTINGKKHDMEMHLVHLNEKNQISVIGFIFDAIDKSKHEDGKEDAEENGVKDNEFLNQFFDELVYKKEDSEKDGKELKNDIVFDSLFEDTGKRMVRENDKILTRIHWWEYDGSLTTPPYTEGVKWMVSQEKYKMSMEQLNNLRKCWDEKDNARDVQDDSGRTVSIRCRRTSLLVT